MRLRVLLFLILTFPLVTGWGHWGPQVKVGLAVDHSQGREVLIKDLKDELADNRADLLLEDAKGDAAVQDDQVKDLIAQGIQALIVIPADPSKAGPLVDAAHKAGIKVLSLGHLIPGMDYLIAFNEKKTGELQAKAAMKVFHQGKYILLGEHTRDWRWLDYQDGLMKVLQPPITGGGIRMQTVYSDPVSTKEVKELNIEAVLKAEGAQTSALLASNSEMTQKAAQARDEAGLSNKLPLAGVGEDLETCRRIVSGTQIVTIYHPPQKLAAETAYLAAKVARKATEFDCQFTDVDNEGVTTKAVLLTPMVVDAKNLDSTIIADGVQKKEEVYGK